MLLVLAVLCAFAWFFGFVVYHVASFAIHLLLVAAVIAVVLHFVRGTTSRRSAGGINRPAV